ncbi:ThuA domain-containing protein [Aquisphaera insulae]|uniref:ThuA domain-containing protein n=1 Tax=Aquisphaera insulae TaxID=2712864 RepID=UPI0013ECBA0F|nr:ThuA domain-containing protein [Aquisphaera insulae]
MSAAAGSSTSPEPWADPGLKVTRGLSLWLDAERLNAARKAHHLAEIADGGRVEIWHDASGRGRDLVQARETARPRLVAGAIRFDGEQTYLERGGPGMEIRDCTLFVVAAPLSNAGGFRGFVSFHQDGREDFTTGLNADLGAGYTNRFEVFNVEGPGFGGMANLMGEPSKFGVVRRLTVSTRSGPGGTAVRVDGIPAGSRARSASTLHAYRLLVGARHYGIPPAVHGFLDGDIIQVLLYDRILGDDERKAVEDYLAARLGKSPAPRPLPASSGHRLVQVDNPPPVQFLIPGFSTRELPIRIANVNNVRYRPDGKLVALAYDGNIHLLSDADGDGLEEKDELFWRNDGGLVAPIGMALTPPGSPAGEGVFVASKGKLSLFLDADRDGKAEKEVVVAGGWKPLNNNVDALGVAVGGDGSIYFGLGTTDFGNAYLVDPAGQSHYDLKDEHGTIQKVSPDFRRRETVATGIRFSVGLAINRLGDLFATDQEGATWLPNGNPFDELLQVVPGRHYGFPPRHPRHLPGVIDEPSVFDYAPQHQSTCGIVFNESVNGGPVFGPPSWAGDALVTGYSRGKLYRTSLVKTRAGYVARNQTMAILSMLTADACVSPRGELVVAVHSGLPDWGTGPRGQGKLYKAAWSDRDAPQPVAAFAAGPQEVRIAFDRPLDPERLRELTRKASIEYGWAVGPGDRFESLRPGYEVVGRQIAAPRNELAVLSSRVSADRRTLSLATPPLRETVSYAVQLPVPGAEKAPAGSLRQFADLDLAFDLSGVRATWKPASGDGEWSGWLPHPDLAVARAFTVGSADHDRLWEAMRRGGKLTLETKLDLWRMLRPAVQPGGDPGYSLPAEEVTLAFEGAGLLTVRSRSPGPSIVGGGHRVRITASPVENQPLPLEITLDTSETTTLDVSWWTKEDPTPRALPLRRVLLPWALPGTSNAEMTRREFPELKGGDWSRGRALFLGEQARCSSCHAVRGRGGRIGPDLSNLVHRDYASVWRDVHSPSAAINPDFVAHVVALNDGRILQGTLRTDGNKLVVGSTDGKVVVVDRSEVETVAASAASIMPEGLDTTLGPEKLRDLLTFLLTDPLAPAPLEHEGAPPPRRRAELDAALKGSTPLENPRRLRIVLSSGPKDHGPGEHDYPLWRTRWAALFATDPGLGVETADGWPSPAQLQTADAVVMYSNNPGWDASRSADLDRFLARGGGLAMIHYAVDGHAAVPELSARIGLAWQGGKSAFRHGPLVLDFEGSRHPIARGLGKLSLIDESYWNLIGDQSSIDLLASGVEDGNPRPLIWTRQLGKGRVFVSIPGHFTWSFDDPLFRLVLLRGIAWAAGEPVDRFNELSTIGARIAD